MNQIRYIRYSRKSSEAKERQALSIPEQNEECENYAMREGLNITYRLEESRSAFKPHNRLDFDKLIALIESKQADAILTWHLNRIARNPEEGGKILQLLQDSVIKEVRTASGEIYTPESDHLVLQIHFGMANQYSRNISKDVKRSLAHKAERGEYPRSAPLGFEGYGERGKKNIRPSNVEALIMREVFELVATGRYSLGYLENTMYEKGVKTKNGKKVSKSHWHAILTNPVYYGYFYHHGELYKGSFEPIVSKSLFNTVQNALQNRSKPKTTSWISNWNGIAKCGYCGCAITTTHKTKHYKRTDRIVGYAYVHCTHRRDNCGQTPITEAEFEQELLKYVEKIRVDEEVWSLGIKLLKQKHQHQTDQTTNQRKHFEKKYDILQQKLNRLITMRADNELTKEEFLIQKEQLLKEQAHIESLLTDAKSSEHGWLELTEQFLTTAFHAREIMKGGSPEEKRTLIMAVGENLLLKDKKLEFSFKKPYDILLLPEYRTDMLPRLDSNQQPSSYSDPLVTKRTGLSHPRYYILRTPSGSGI